MNAVVATNRTAVLENIIAIMEPMKEQKIQITVSAINAATCATQKRETGTKIAISTGPNETKKDHENNTRQKNQKMSSNKE